MSSLKLIWDFRGPASEKTAEHHLIHLKEFIKREQIDVDIFGTERHSEMHSIAFLVCTQEDMPLLRDRLKPHRGQHYNS